MFYCFARKSLVSQAFAVEAKSQTRSLRAVGECPTPAIRYFTRESPRSSLTAFDAQGDVSVGLRQKRPETLREAIEPTGPRATEKGGRAKTRSLGARHRPTAFGETPALALANTFDEADGTKVAQKLPSPTGLDADR